MNCLMVQGTTSDAGKSTLVAGLARLLKKRGVKVAPFKPQNMALNSAVTADGGEIGRSQALQAQACGLDSHTDMNPVLLKPASDTGAQVIIHGRALGNMQALDYHAYKATAKNAVLASFDRLRQQYDCILVEGAGSPAEINLRENDIANMGFAEAVDCPVILVADIDRGGVFAHLVGTLELLSPSERARVKGFVINRFRGDLSLLQPGLDWLEQKTGKPVLGVLPYLTDFFLDAEDAIHNAQRQGGAPLLKVIVPVLPRISNHTDFDPLRLHPQVDFQYLSAADELPPCDLVILPGSKSVRADLQHLLANGWRHKLDRHLRYGGKILGICGGLQMLGEFIDDPNGMEGTPGLTTGLGYLDYSTELLEDKKLRNRHGRLTLNNLSVPFTGYEIHCGATNGPALASGVFKVHGEEGETSDGSLSEDGNILATYMHGLFDHPEALEQLLLWAGFASQSPAQFDLNAHRETQLERLAEVFEQHLDESWLTGLAAQ